MYFFKHNFKHKTQKKTLAISFQIHFLKVNLRENCVLKKGVGPPNKNLMTTALYRVEVLFSKDNPMSSLAC